MLMHMLREVRLRHGAATGLLLRLLKQK